MQKGLKDARLKLAEIEDLQEKLDKLKGRAMGLEAKVNKLKTKMSDAKKVSITEFKELDTYKLALNITIAQFLTKERLKIK